MSAMKSGMNALIAGGRAVAHARELENWWISPDGSCEDVSQVSSIVAPPNGQNTLVMEYTVPEGYTFSLRGVLWQYDGEGFINGAGDLVGVLDVDRLIGAAGRQGYAVPFFESVKYLRGNNQDFWPLSGRRVFMPNQVIRWKVTTAAPIPEGGENYITAGIFGWTRPLHVAGAL